jgi:hypothetical protein
MNKTIIRLKIMIFGMHITVHLDMLFVDLELKATSDGLQYFEFTERETKTRKGQGAARSFAPKMLAQPGTYSIIS